MTIGLIMTIISTAKMIGTIISIDRNNNNVYNNNDSVNNITNTNNNKKQ
jgi:hypothetical protein